MLRWSTCVLAALVFQCAALTALAQNAAGCAIATRAEKIGSGTIVYNVAGAGPSILLVHGLFANKEQWSPLACRLVEAGYQVIAVDLPGYGKSQGYPLTSYPLANEVESLRALMTRLDIKEFDLAGNSMGGAIASLYASRYPRQVRSLAFIGSPLGIIEWSQEMHDAIYRGVNPFIPVDEAQLDLELQLLFVTPPAIPGEHRKAIVADYVRRNRHYVQVWNVVNLYNDILKQRLPARKPTLIVWGDDDRVYNVAGAEKLQRRIPSSNLHHLPRAGHLLHLENAAEVAPIYIDFLRSTGKAPASQ
jgi:pimeloyl-ACP methyl ester carboxylesterase